MVFGFIVWQGEVVCILRWRQKRCSYSTTREEADEVQERREISSAIYQFQCARLLRFNEMNGDMSESEW